MSSFWGAGGIAWDIRRVERRERTGRRIESIDAVLDRVKGIKVKMKQLQCLKHETSSIQPTLVNWDAPPTATHNQLLDLFYTCLYLKHTTTMSDSEADDPMTTHAGEPRDDGQMKPEDQGKALDDMVRSFLGFVVCIQLIRVGSSRTARTTPLPPHEKPTLRPPTRNQKQKPPHTDPPSQMTTKPPQTATWAAAGTRDMTRMIRIDWSTRRRRREFR